MNHLRYTLLSALAFLLVSTPVYAQLGTVPYTFSAGTVIKSADVNTMFSAIYSNALNRTGGVMTGSLQTTTIEVGHATDTTLARVSAGVVSIEGSNILLASGLGSITQAYDADLDTWAGVTPGSGVTTWIATPSSSNLATAVTGETGSGALVFGTTPSLTTPNVVGTTSGAMSIAGDMYSHVLLAIGYNGTSPLNEPHQVGAYSALVGNSSTGTGTTGSAATDGYVIGFETANGTDAGGATVPWVVNYSIGSVTVGSGDTVTRTIGLQSIDETAGTNNAFIAPYYTTFTGNWYIYYPGSRPSWLGEGALTVGNEVYRSADDDYIRVSGGDGGGTGANLLLYGSTHATQANNAFLAATSLTITAPTTTVTASTGVTFTTPSITTSGKLIMNSTTSPNSNSGEWGYSSTYGSYVFGKAGSVYDFSVYNADGYPSIVVTVDSDTLLYSRNALALTLGASQAATFAGTVTGQVSGSSFTTDLKVLGVEGGAATLYLWADEGDDVPDKATIAMDPSGALIISHNLTVGLLSLTDTLITTGSNTDLTLGANSVFTVPALQSSSGTRYICVDTSGTFSSSASACSGTDPDILADRIAWLESRLAALEGR